MESPNNEQTSNMVTESNKNETTHSKDHVIEEGEIGSNNERSNRRDTVSSKESDVSTFKGISCYQVFNVHIVSIIPRNSCQFSTF